MILEASAYIEPHEWKSSKINNQILPYFRFYAKVSDLDLS